MEVLCKTMQDCIIEHLPRIIRPGTDLAIDTVGYAMRSVYADITNSKHTFVYEAEACKPIPLTCVFPF